MADSKVRNSTVEEQEEWKWIDGYENVYQISTNGRVKSWAKIGTSNSINKEPHLIKPSLGSLGYYRVNIQGRVFRIHRLVAETFIPNPGNKPTVNHKDGDKTNNYYKNLEWATYSENNKHAYSKGLKKISKEQRKKVSKRFRGSKSHKSKLTESDILRIRRLLSDRDLTHNQIGDRFGVSRQTISDINNGRSWTHI